MPTPQKSSKHNNRQGNIGKKSNSARSLPPTQKRPPMPKVKPSKPSKG